MDAVPGGRAMGGRIPFQLPARELRLVGNIVDVTERFFCRVDVIEEFPPRHRV